MIIDINPFIGYYDTIQIKKGGMSFVFISELRDKKLSIEKIFQERVAIKTLKPELANHDIISELFYKECVLWLAAGNHSNVVKAYTAHQSQPDAPFIVLELADCNLREYLLSHNIDVAGKLRLLFEICQGLIHLNSELEDFVHLDLKPDNILIYNHVAKISDFGLSRIKMKIESLKITDIDGLGTPLYMSPEQIKGGPLTIKSDIYSFGCIMFEVLSGYPVFYPLNLGSKEEIYNFHVNTFPQDIRRVAKNIFVELAEIINTCLNKKPELRFNSFSEIARLIESIAQKYFNSDFLLGVKKEMESHEFYNFCQGLFNLQYFEDTIANIENNPHLISSESINSFKILKARALINYGKAEDALKALSEIVYTDLSKSDLFGYFFTHLKYYYHKEEFQDAVLYAQKALSIDQNSNETWAMLSFSLWNIKKEWEAIEAMFTAVRVSRKLNYYLLLIDQIWLFNQNMKFILEIYNEAIGFHPINYRPYLKIASILIESFEQDKEASFESKVKGLHLIKNYVDRAAFLNAPNKLIESYNEKLNSLN